jgi:hypothetical protein
MGIVSALWWLKLEETSLAGTTWCAQYAQSLEQTDFNIIHTTD